MPSDFLTLTVTLEFISWIAFASISQPLSHYLFPMPLSSSVMWHQISADNAPVKRCQMLYHSKAFMSMQIVVDHNIGLLA